MSSIQKCTHEFRGNWQGIRGAYVGNHC